MGRGITKCVSRGRGTSAAKVLTVSSPGDGLPMLSSLSCFALEADEGDYDPSEEFNWSRQKPDREGELLTASTADPRKASPCDSLRSPP